jgi:hypothetical protein
MAQPTVQDTNQHLWQFSENQKYMECGKCKMKVHLPHPWVLEEMHLTINEYLNTHEWAVTICPGDIYR